MSKPSNQTLHIALPKGKMEASIFKLLTDAGFTVRTGKRDYRPLLSPPLPRHAFEVKMLKPQNIIEMLHIGSRDLGFAGQDWVRELRADVVELLDTGLDPVKIVAAAPKSILKKGRLPTRPLVVASEYEHLAQDWIRKKKLKARFVRSYGATEVFPPEDADCIIDNSATGETLLANQLEVLDVLMTSSTRLYTHAKVLKDKAKRESVEHLVMLFNSALEARKRVMLEVNVEEKNLESLIKILPCMRRPTVAQLYKGAGYAVKAAVPKDQLPILIADIKRHGGTDIVVTELSKIVP